MTIQDEAVQADKALWRVNIKGPDDIISAPDYLSAVRMANTFNAWWLDLITKTPLKDNHPHMWAEPIEWPYSEGHGEDVTDTNNEYQWLRELTAAMPFLTGVKVKALNWTKPPLSETLSRCETEFGTYRTWTHDEANGKWFWSVEGGYNEVGGSAKDEAAAKAAAQADYEARTLSAIEFAPSQRAQALEKLPCDVRLPGVTLQRGVKFSVLLDALKRRESWSDADRSLSQPVAEGPERGKFYHKHWELSKLLEARNGGLVDHSGGEAWRYEYTSKDENGKYDMLYRHNVNASVPARLPASPGASE
ncbi:hypothetical protein ABE530_04020 [Brucella sp. TWI559]